MTIQTPLASLNQPSSPVAPEPASYGIQSSLVILLLPAIALARRRKAVVVFFAAASCILLATLATGCGNRINADNASISSTTYTLTVIGTATDPTGSALQHSAIVTLQVLH
jgi:uncharacterized membrane protein